MAGEVRRDGDDERGRAQRDAQFPGPEHQIEVILAAHLAPEGEHHFDGHQKLDHQKRAKHVIRHTAR